VATLGVVAYRLINFWLPIPLGGVAYVSLQVENGAASGRRRARFQSIRSKVDAAIHRPGRNVSHKTPEP
jgi:hypothetical protein